MLLANLELSLAVSVGKSSL